MNNAFGFTQPEQAQQFPFYTAQNPMQYVGAQPAAMFGPNAAPTGPVQPGFNFQGLSGPLGMIGANLLQQSQNHQRPASIGGALISSLPGLMQNPQVQQGLQSGAQGLMGLFQGAGAAGA